VPVSVDPAEGLAVVRLRDRGAAVEATVCEILVPDKGVRGPLLREVARATDADYLMVAGGVVRDGLVPLPHQGPVLTWRAVCRATAPPLRGWDLQLGDVELL